MFKEVPPDTVALPFAPTEPPGVVPVPAPPPVQDTKEPKDDVDPDDPFPSGTDPPDPPDPTVIATGPDTGTFDTKAYPPYPPALPVGPGVVGGALPPPPPPTTQTFTCVAEEGLVHVPGLVNN
jgi:hypothetical protein